MDDVKTQIAELLTQSQITATFKYVPSDYDAKGEFPSRYPEASWNALHWRVTFTSPRGAFTTDYKQGLGHLPPEVYPRNMRSISINQDAALKRTLATGKLCHIRQSTDYAKPIPTPDPVDVLGCLFMDAGAAEYSSFEDWAQDFGSNPDSIKALNAYNACRNTALDLFRVLGSALVEKIKPLAQEL